MIGRLFLSIAATIGAASGSACNTAEMDNEQAALEPPSREEVQRQALACGLRPENLAFDVDEEGVVDTMISPVGDADGRYQASVECMVEWAAATGAAVGFDLPGAQPR